MIQQSVVINQNHVSYQISEHAQVRIQQRGISYQCLKRALQYGRRVHIRGADIHVIGKKEIKHFDRKGIKLDGLDGIHVVCNEQDKVILTAYKNSCLRGLRPKRKHR